LLADATRKSVQQAPWSKLGRLDALDEHLADVDRLVVRGAWDVTPSAIDRDAASDSDGDFETPLDHKHTAPSGGCSFYFF